MSYKLSESIEEYLEILYKHGWEGNPVNTTLISKKLNIAPGSVTQMLKKLDDIGYIKHVPYKGAILTKKGLIKSKHMTRKHRLLERFLIEILEIKEEKVHKQACDMEHSLSDDAERSICLLLNHPSLCPDGKFIPECNFNLSNCNECLNRKKEDLESIGYREEILMPLSHVKEDNSVKILFIRGDKDDLTALEKKGIKINSEAEVKINQYEKTLNINKKEINLNELPKNDIFIILKND